MAEVFKLTDIHPAVLNVPKQLIYPSVPLWVLNAQFADFLNNHEVMLIFVIDKALPEGVRACHMFGREMHC